MVSPASTAIVGVATAWLVVGFDFPLRRHFFSWALVLPLAVPPYLAAYAFGEFFLFTGPVQAGAALALRLREHPRLLVSRHTLDAAARRSC